MANVISKRRAQELVCIRPDIPIIQPTVYSEKIFKAKSKSTGICVESLRPPRPWSSNTVSSSPLRKKYLFI